MRFTEHLGELRQRLKVVFLSLSVIFAVLLLVPRNPYEFLSLTGTYNPLVSIFLDRIVQDILPAGWKLIGFHVNEGLEIVLVAWSHLVPLAQQCGNLGFGQRDRLGRHR